MTKSAEDEVPIETNRQALHLFEITERYEAGVSLLGTEVKSLRAGGSNLRDAFARINKSEAFIHNWHISPYTHGNFQNHEPLRTRKLLLRRSEIRKLIGSTRATGLTLVPLRIYLKAGKVKIEIGLAKARKVHDKREAIKRKELKREADRARSSRDRDE